MGDVHHWGYYATGVEVVFDRMRFLSDPAVQQLATMLSAWVTDVPAALESLQLLLKSVKGVEKVCIDGSQIYLKLFASAIPQRVLEEVTVLLRQVFREEVILEFSVKRDAIDQFKNRNPECFR